MHSGPSFSGRLVGQKVTLTYNVKPSRKVGGAKGHPDLQYQTAQEGDLACRWWTILSISTGNEQFLCQSQRWISLVWTSLGTSKKCVKLRYYPDIYLHLGVPVHSLFSGNHVVFSLRSGWMWQSHGFVVLL